MKFDFKKFCKELDKTKEVNDFDERQRVAGLLQLCTQEVEVTSELLDSISMEDIDKALKYVSTYEESTKDGNLLCEMVQAEYAKDNLSNQKSQRTDEEDIIDFF